MNLCMKATCVKVRDLAYRFVHADALLDGGASTGGPKFLRLLVLCRLVAQVQRRFPMIQIHTLLHVRNIRPHAQKLNAIHSILCYVGSWILTPVVRTGAPRCSARFFRAFVRTGAGSGSVQEARQNHLVRTGVVPEHQKTTWAHQGHNENLKPCS